MHLLVSLAARCGYECVSVSACVLEEVGKGLPPFLLSGMEETLYLGLE